MLLASYMVVTSSFSSFPLFAIFTPPSLSPPHTHYRFNRALFFSWFLARSLAFWQSLHLALRSNTPPFLACAKVKNIILSPIARQYLKVELGGRKRSATRGARLAVAHVVGRTLDERRFAAIAASLLAWLGSERQPQPLQLVTLHSLVSCHSTKEEKKKNTLRRYSL